MTGAQLVSLTKQHVGYRAGSNVNDNWYVDRVNEAYKALTTFVDPQTRREIRFPELFATIDRNVVGSGLTNNFVPNSTAVWSVLGLYDDTNDYHIPLKSYRSLVKHNPADAGRILKWARAGNGTTGGYLIWKVPATTVVLREYVYKTAETLANNATSPVITADWHEAIHLLAGAKAAMLVDQTEKSKMLFDAFLTTVRTKRSPAAENIGPSRSFRMSRS